MYFYFLGLVVDFVLMADYQEQFLSQVTYHSGHHIPTIYLKLLLWCSMDGDLNLTSPTFWDNLPTMGGCGLHLDVHIETCARIDYKLGDID